mmetsp:Transcript_26526/g.61918  ORF Transcript_26526/g.61918 Transcript_26526/m.61918 type:complete len:889 (+) Transcript_26526:110-2776(+)
MVDLLSVPQGFDDSGVAPAILRFPGRLASPARSPAKQSGARSPTRGKNTQEVIVNTNAKCSAKFMRALADLVRVHEEETLRPSSSQKRGSISESSNHDFLRQVLWGKQGSESPPEQRPTKDFFDFNTHDSQEEPQEALLEGVLQPRSSPALHLGLDSKEPDQCRPPWFEGSNGDHSDQVSVSKLSSAQSYPPVSSMKSSMSRGVSPGNFVSFGNTFQVDSYEAGNFQSNSSSGQTASRSPMKDLKPPIQRWEWLVSALLIGADDRVLDTHDLSSLERSGWDLELQSIWMQRVDPKNLPTNSIGLGPPEVPNVQSTKSTSVNDTMVSLPEELPDDDVHKDHGFLQRFVAHPTGRRVVVFGAIAWIFFIASAILNPLYLVTTDRLVLAIVSLYRPVPTIFWTIDMLFQFFTGFEHRLCTEMRPYFVARHYLRTWFLPDLLVLLVDIALCTYVFQHGAVVHSLKTASVSKRILHTLALLHLLRAHRIRDAVSLAFERTTSEHRRLALKLMILIGQIFMLAHYIACAWLDLGGHSDHITWMQAFLPEVESFAELYVASLHWSLTQFTPSTNLVGPTNFEERSFAVLVVASALVVFTCFISHLTALFNQMRTLTMQERVEAGRMRQYIKNRNISNNLSYRIQHFMHKQRHQGGVESDLLEEDVPVFANMPHRLKSLLHMELYYNHVRSVRIFKAFRKTMHLAGQIAVCGCREAFIKPLEEAFQSGVEAVDLYMVASGLMRYHVESRPLDYTSGDVLLDGNNARWLAEAALSVRWYHTGNFAGASRSRLIMVDVKTTTEVMCVNAQLHCMMRAYSIYLLQFLEAASARGEHFSDFGPSETEINHMLSKSARTVSLRQSAVSVALGVAQPSKEETSDDGLLRTVSKRSSHVAAQF